MVFLAFMIGGAGLSFCRVLVVAMNLDSQSFADYAVIVATSAFLSSFISFGGIEATIKRFPRMAANGNFGEMQLQSGVILRQIAIRAIALGVIAFVIGSLTRASPIFAIGAAFFLALPTGYTAIIASKQRAVGNARSLASGTVFRAVLSIIGVSLVSTFGSLWAVVLAEAAMAALGCLISEIIIKKAIAKSTRLLAADMNNPVADENISQTADLQNRANDGLLIFLTYSVISAPFYLDRLYVSVTDGKSEAARYAILAIFLSAASLLVNVVGQRVGPDAVRLAMHSQSRKLAYRHVAVWCIIASAAWVSFLLALASAFHFELIPAGLKKYDV